MTCNLCEKSLEGLKEIDHPINVKNSPKPFGASMNYQVYQCPWCQEYWGEYERKLPIPPGKIDRSIAPLGMDLGKLKRHTD